jgi:hypothetical protein
MAIAIYPACIEIMNVAGAPFERWTAVDGASVENFEIVIGGIEVVVEEAPRGVSTIPANIDVFGLGRKHESVDGQMGFYAAPMGLGFKSGERFRRHNA